MAASLVAFLAVLLPAWAAAVVAPVVHENQSPVKRVVGLLGKMKAELEAEAAHESEMYDKMVCWCETSEKEKTTAVAKADASIQDLQAEIEERAAGFGKVATEIEAMKRQIAEDTATLKTATALREKEAGEFRADEQATVQAIDNLRNAIAVLGKHQGAKRGLDQGSLLQLDAPELSGLRVVLRDVALQHEALQAQSPRVAFLALGAASRNADGESATKMLLGALGSDSSDEALPLKFAERVLARSAAANAHGAGFLQTEKQPLSQSYATQSDGIFGILNQMLEDFQGQLKASQGGEGTAGEDYEAIAKAKTEQIALGKEKLDDFEGQHAGNQKALSDAKENLDLTSKQRTADVEFLRNLKLTCNDLDSQWEARSKTRSEETVAVAETIAILTEDDNHEQLKAGGVVALVQLDRSAAATRALRSRAAVALRRAAKAPEFESDDLLAAWRSHAHAASASLAQGPRAQLSTLAVSVQLDAFEKVKQMIDTLVAELKEQQAEEVKFKAYCGKELNANEKATFDKNEEKEDLETKLAQLAALMQRLAQEIEEANAQIAATQLEVKTASQGRETDNANFQTVVSDQRATQDILHKALQRMKDFYKPRLAGNAPPGLLQQSGKQTPPVQFNDYKANAGSSPVMGLIEQIIGDSKALEEEATSAERKAQADYEGMVKDSNALVADLNEAVNQKTKASAGAKIESGASQSGHDSAVGELESLAEYEADLHQQCDFVLKNFPIRQKARLQEMEAISQAKGILSGAASA